MSRLYSNRDGYLVRIMTGREPTLEDAIELARERFGMITQEQHAIIEAAIPEIVALRNDVSEDEVRAMLERVAEAENENEVDAPSR